MPVRGGVGGVRFGRLARKFTPASNGQFLPHFSRSDRRSGSPLGAPSRQTIKALVVFLVLFAGCLIYGRLNFYRDPDSVFYDESRAFVRRYSALREEQAAAFIDAAKQQPAVGDLATTKAGEHPRICATFLTVARKDMQSQYLDNSIGSALDRLTPDERADTDLKVFFADPNPATHPTWHEPWLRTLVDEAYGYANISPAAQAVGDKLESFHSPFYRSPWDYSFALEHCYEKSSAPYIAMFEDDVLIAEGWVARALQGVWDVERKTVSRGQAGKWLYVRLFNEERATGWHSRRVGANHELWISLVVALAVCGAWRVAGKYSRLARRIEGGSVAVLCCVAVPAFVVLFFQAGKASLLPPSPGTREEFFGCCAQAIVFNRQHMPGLTEYLKTANTGQGQDHVTRDYAYITNLTRWSLYPMSVQHVGWTSTIQADKQKARSVWSMAFEDLDSKRLCRDHERAVRTIYGGRRKLCT